MLEGRLVVGTGVGVGIESDADEIRQDISSTLESVLL